MDVTNEEIIAVADGTANSEIELRVTAAALLDARVRERLESLRTLETRPLRVAERDGGFAARAHRLREAMEIGARRIARELREEQAGDAPARAGPAATPPAWREGILRLLDIARQAVTLPCLAPGQAAPALLTEIRRDIFLFEGVRVELQQLPGEGARLRFYADASGIVGGFASLGAQQLALTLENLGTVFIALNLEGRGYRDLVVGQDLPHPRKAVSLVELALLP
jgi:hypothetical protein